MTVNTAPFEVGERDGVLVCVEGHLGSCVDWPDERVDGELEVDAGGRVERAGVLAQREVRRRRRSRSCRSAVGIAVDGDDHVATVGEEDLVVGLGLDDCLGVGIAGGAVGHIDGCRRRCRTRRVRTPPRSGQHRGGGGAWRRTSSCSWCCQRYRPSPTPIRALRPDPRERATSARTSVHDGAGIAQRMVRVISPPAGRRATVSDIGSHGSRSGSRVHAASVRLRQRRSAGTPGGRRTASAAV